MDFDEYEYLENMVENSEHKKLEDKKDMSDGIDESEDKERSRRSKHRSGDDRDMERSSKASRSDRESRDREKDRRSHHGASSRDRERDEKDKHKSSRENRNRDKEESGGRDKDRDKDRVSDREKDRDRNNDKKRDENKDRRSREHERDLEGEPERSKQSRSHSERDHVTRERERSRGMENIDKDFQERRRDREFRDRNLEPRRYKDKKDGAEEPPADPDRDQRTVFAYQISLKAAEKDVYAFFSTAGKVRDVRIITDRNSGRSKGFGYIEFFDAMSVPMAIALSGQPLLGQPMMVKPSEAEKNLVQPTPAGSGAGGLLGPYSGGARKLYVGNLPYTIKEDQLRQVFEPFGTVEQVQMPMDPGTGNCKGFAFIQFARLEDAKLAQNLNGQLEIAGQVIKVCAVTDQVGLQDAGANIADLDDDDGNGLSLNANSRALLMQKLDRTGAASSINGSFTTSVGDNNSFSMPPTIASAIDPIGVPSECLLLKNMFDPNSEAEPDFDLDIKEDVGEECSKFGKLKHIFVDKNTAGFVYLRFDNTQAAIAAQQALHGRWFAGKMITASFMFPHDYEAKFPNGS